MAERALPGLIKRKSNRMIFLLALVFGVISAILVAVAISSSSDEEGGSVGISPAVVATRDIEAGTRITTDMVSLKSFSSDALVANRITKSEDAVGKVATVDILSGEQISASRVVAVNETGQELKSSTLAGSVPLTKPAAQCAVDKCGQRAASVGVAPVSASGGLIRPGDRVDVILSFRDASAITILQDIEVLGIDQKVVRVVSGSAASEQDGGNTVRTQVDPDTDEDAKATTATLAVWPNEAQKLLAGEEFTKGAQVKLTPLTAKELGLPEDSEFECKGSVRLVTRHTGQQGLTEVPEQTKGGMCSRLFQYAWAGK